MTRQSTSLRAFGLLSLGAALVAAGCAGRSSSEYQDSAGKGGGAGVSSISVVAAGTGGVGLASSGSGAMAVGGVGAGAAGKLEMSHSGSTGVVELPQGGAIGEGGVGGDVAAGGTAGQSESVGEGGEAGASNPGPFWLDPGADAACEPGYVKECDGAYNWYCTANPLPMNPGIQAIGSSAAYCASAPCILNRMSGADEFHCPGRPVVVVCAEGFELPANCKNSEHLKRNYYCCDL